MEVFAHILQKYGALYWQGLLMTVELTALSLAAGFVLAWPLAVALHSRRRLARIPARGFVYIMTGTPLLVQLFLVYYGTGQFEAVRESALWHYLREPYWCALAAFSLNTAAYSAEIFGGAIRNTAPGEIEAAKGMGMGGMQIFTRIVAPSAFRRALPAYGNEMIFLMHGTSLASVVTILDLTAAARETAYRTLANSEALLVAAVLYMGLTALLACGVKFGEKRMLAHLRPATI